MNTPATIMEVHTSDLTATCARAVELRLNGKAVRQTQSAVAWGLLWHEAVQTCHRLGKFDATSVMAVVPPAWDRVMKQAKKENSPPSPAVSASATTIMAEVAALLPVYGERVAPEVGKVLGTELPIRCTIDVDGEPVEFASHLDMLARRKDGTLAFYDEKSGEDAPSFWELSRNMQFGMYAYALRHGAVLLDGEWVEFNEWAPGYWIHVRNLKPFGRATKMKEPDPETGELVEVTYAKGESRPIQRIIIPAGVYPEGEGEILRRFGDHVRMRRQGLMVANPGEHCRFCDSVKWCANLGGEGE